jgi:hypothetical protein
MNTEQENFRKHQFTFAERWAVHQAYEQICIYCGNVVAWRDFEVDHIINESLLKEPQKLNSLINDYGLGSDFSINGFENWACTHHSCNRVKSDTTFDKSRALHYLLIAGQKAKAARQIYRATQNVNTVNKVFARLRVLMENGTITRQEIVDFAKAAVDNADIGVGNPAVITFGLAMEDVYQNMPEGVPDSPPYIYDWLENELAKELQRTLECRMELLESQRNGETISVRYAMWDLDFSRLDNLQLEWWEILELRLYTHIYRDFAKRDE